MFNTIQQTFIRKEEIGKYLQIFIIIFTFLSLLLMRMICIGLKVPFQTVVKLKGVI